MAGAPSQIQQTNVVANRARHLIFFENEGLAYNYKTDQWSLVSAYAGYGFFTVNDKTVDIGLIVFSSGSVDLQEQSTSAVAQTATFTTGAIDLNKGGRCIVNGIRPLSNGGTHALRVGTQDSESASVTWCTGTSVNSRSGYSNFRNASNPPEGKYVRGEVTITGGFTTFTGAEVDYASAGYV